MSLEYLRFLLRFGCLASPRTDRYDDINDTNCVMTFETIDDEVIWKLDNWSLQEMQNCFITLR